MKRVDPLTPVLLHRPVPLLQQPPGENDCGPHAAAMAIGYYQPAGCDAAQIAGRIWFLRVPLIGATLPWGVTCALRSHALRAAGGWFSTLAALKEHVAADRPVIVIVRPSDLARCPWYALHYRVVVGYRDDPLLPGGGELYFNCSATPPRESVTGGPGNLTVDCATFRRQWRTFLTYNWSAAVMPR